MFFFFYLDTRNFYHEHGSPQDVTCCVTPEFDAAYFRLLVKVNGFYFVHTLFNVNLTVQHLICANVAAKEDVISVKNL